ATSMPNLSAITSWLYRTFGRNSGSLRQGSTPMVAFAQVIILVEPTLEDSQVMRVALALERTCKTLQVKCEVSSSQTQERSSLTLILSRLSPAQLARLYGTLLRTRATSTSVKVEIYIPPSAE